jgi:hypothetical protein
VTNSVSFNISDFGAVVMLALFLGAERSDECSWRSAVEALIRTASLKRDVHHKRASTSLRSAWQTTPPSVSVKNYSISI